MKIRTLISLAIVAILVVGIFGCSEPGSSVKTVPVEGKVLLDGSPVDGATVTFTPTWSEGRTAVGTTDSNGEFTLTTAGVGPGAMPGSYKVAVSKTTTVSADSSSATSEEEGMKEIEKMMQGGSEVGPAAPLESKDELPAEYSSPDTSGFTAEVKESGENNFVFELKSGGGGTGGEAGSE